MTDPRPTPMDRAPQDPTAPLLGPGQWHREAPVFRKGEAPAHVALIAMLIAAKIAWGRRKRRKVNAALAADSANND